MTTSIQAFKKFYDIDVDAPKGGYTPNIQALVDAQKEMNRCVTSLHLELLPEIAEDVQRIWNNLTQALADYHKSQKEDWISVEDELPEYGIKVLVLGEQMGMNPQMGGAYISIGMRQNLKGTQLEKQADRHQDKNQFKLMTYVTHWMPLPQKPKLSFMGDVAGSQTNSIDKK